MKKKFKKQLKFLTNLLVFLLFLAVFIFSAYKIINYTGILKKNVWGISCGDCGFCPDCPWECPICPRPTPPEPTPTVPEPTPTEPEPTPTVPEPSPTPPEPTPTPTPVPPGQPPAAGGPGEPYVCGAEVPPAPTLLSATRSSSTQVDLAWTAVVPVTHYSIVYGLSSGNYIYGVDNTGNVTNFTVGSLDPATNYCFAVRAVNGCAPSGLSNEICPGEVLGVAAGQILGVTILADTGTLDDEIFQILFIIGSVCLTFGLRIFLPAKKKALF